MFLDGQDKRSGCSRIPPLQEQSETDNSELDIEFSDIQVAGLCRDRWLALSHCRSLLDINDNIRSMYLLGLKRRVGLEGYDNMGGRGCSLRASSGESH